MTKNDDYRPIACGAYSELEVLVLRGTPVRLRWRAPDGAVREVCGRPVDLRSRDGAEYLCLRTASGVCEIRLDRLLGSPVPEPGDGNSTIGPDANQGIE